MNFIHFIRSGRQCPSRFMALYSFLHIKIVLFATDSMILCVLAKSSTQQSMQKKTTLISDTCKQEERKKVNLKINSSTKRSKSSAGFIFPIQ